MKTLYGVCPPVITIFGKNGNIDYEANKKHADFLIEKGVDGLAYLGTSGEFSIMTLDEKKEFMREMSAYVGGRVQVIVGVGSTSLKETLELLKCAEEASVDGCLLVNPYFSVYDETMVEAYYDYVAKQTKLPIIIYNFPDLTGFNFSAALVERLVKKHENIVGIKDTIEDSAHLIEMIKIQEIRPEFTVFCAYENQALGSLVNGAGGLINATANFAPEFTVGLYQSFQNGDMKKASEYFNQLCHAMDIYGYSKPLFLACKQAVYERVLGYNGVERLPAVSLGEEKRRAIADKLKELGL